MSRGWSINFVDATSLGIIRYCLSARVTVRVGHFDIGVWSLWLARVCYREQDFWPWGPKNISAGKHTAGIYMKQVLLLFRFEPHHLKWVIAGLGFLLLQTQE